MAFELYQDDLNTSPQLTYVDATAEETYVPGELLKISAAGTATKASGTDAPVYLCNTRKTAAAGDQIQVIRLQRTHKLRTTLSAAGTSLKVGNKVTIGADGLEATATTTGGTLELVTIIDSGKGGSVIVRVQDADAPSGT